MDDAAIYPWLALALALPPGTSVPRRLRERYPDPPALADLGATLGRALGTDREAALLARRRLVAPHGPLAAAHVAALCRERGRERGRESVRHRADAALAWRAADPDDRHLLAIADPAYPALLRASLDPPPLLWVRGRPRALAGPAVAMVGSRRATHAGRELAAAFAAELSAAGVTVASGLALGIDAAAHAGALGGPGGTFAFMATGIDRMYPARHAPLARRMLAAGGALATEFPPGHPPLPWGFPLRNRLISGASLATVVVEAALPSGSLTTARHALEQGREVMAVPGPVGSRTAAGCHALIVDGAALVSGAGDVLRLLAEPLARALEAQAVSGDGPAGRTADTAKSALVSPGTPGSTTPPTPPAPPTPPTPPWLDGDARRVWDCLEGGAAGAELLAARSALALPTLLATLAALELDGLVRGEGGGRYARCTPAALPLAAPPSRRGR